MICFRHSAGESLAGDVSRSPRKPLTPARFLLIY